MNSIEVEPFNLYSIYYDLLYSSKNYEQEASYVQGLLQRLNPAIIEILELGSGTGNYAEVLCRKGYYVTGIEKSKLMLEQSKRKMIDGFYPMAANMVEFELGKKFDAVISLFHVISYLTETKDIVSCFKSIAKHLKDNGVFVFDVWYTPAVYSQKAEYRIKEVENDLYKITRHAEPEINEEKNTVDVVYEILITEKSPEQYHKVKEIHKMRHFSTPEMALLADLAGLKLIGSEEFLTAKIPSVDTWGVCYMLQKK